MLDVKSSVRLHKATIAEFGGRTLSSHTFLAETCFEELEVTRMRLRSGSGVRRAASVHEILDVYVVKLYVDSFDVVLARCHLGPDGHGASGEVTLSLDVCVEVLDIFRVIWNR